MTKYLARFSPTSDLELALRAARAGAEVVAAKGTVTDQAGHPVSTRTPFVEASNGLTPGRFLETFRDGFS